jgi:hypothetical protein
MAILKVLMGKRSFSSAFTGESLPTRVAALSAEIATSQLNLKILTSRVTVVIDEVIACLQVLFIAV